MNEKEKIVVVQSGGASSIFWGLVLFFIVLPCVITFGCFACIGVGGSMVVNEAIEHSEKTRKEQQRPHPQPTFVPTFVVPKVEPKTTMIEEKKQQESTKPLPEIKELPKETIQSNFVPSVPIETLDSKWHNWSSVDGKFTIKARFLRATSGVVFMEKEDGEKINVPLDKLSKEDVEWVEKRGWEKPPESVLKKL